MSIQVPKVLYHYCSLPTFQKIIEGRSIWLSDISKSNDFMELVWVYKELKKYCKELQLKYLKSQIEKYKIGESVPKYDSEDHKKELLLIEDNLTSPQYDTYAFCLSEVKDQLSQWRGYADDGNGICIGFNMEYFNCMNKDSVSTNEFLLRKVNYGEKEFMAFIESQSILGNYSNDKSSAENYRIVENALQTIHTYEAFYKNPAFIEEYEWRIAFSSAGLTQINKEFGGILCKEIYENKAFSANFSKATLTYRSTSKDLIMSIELGIKDIKNAISSIYIGPKSRVSTYDIKQFLIYNDILESFKDDSIEIYNSSASYR